MCIPSPLLALSTLLLGASLTESAMMPRKQSSSLAENPGQNPLCERNWIIAISTGRAGSTSLMGMLNDVPRISMYGENEGVLMFAHGQLASHGIDAVDGPYSHGRLNMPKYFKSLQEFIVNMMGHNDDNADVHYVGYKQLANRVPSYDFLRQAFPCAKIILNYRHNLTAQAESYEELKWLPKHAGPNYVEEVRPWLRKVCLSLSKPGIWVRYRRGVRGRGCMCKSYCIMRVLAMHAQNDTKKFS